MCSAAAEMLTSEPAVEMLADSFDQLDREDPFDLSSTALGQQIEALFTMQNRLSATITRHLAVFDGTQGYAAFDT